MRRKINPKVLGFLWFIFVLAFVTSMLMVSFFLTAYIYQIANLNPPALLIQIINSLLGLFLTGLLLGAVGKVARSKGWIPEMNVFRPIIEALERIARGDFSVRLDEWRGEKHNL